MLLCETSTWHLLMTSVIVHYIIYLYMTMIFRIFWGIKWFRFAFFMRKFFYLCIMLTRKLNAFLRYFLLSSGFFRLEYFNFLFLTTEIISYSRIQRFKWILKSFILKLIVINKKELLKQTQEVLKTKFFKEKFSKQLK